MYKDSDILVNNKMYNAEELFLINSYAVPEIVEFTHEGKKYNYVIIDNFYNYPELIKEISMNAVSTKAVNRNYPGYRNKFLMDQSFNMVYLDKIMKHFFGDIETLSNRSLDEVVFNLTKSSKAYGWDNKLPSKSCIPHIDSAGDCIYAGLVYLNKENEYSKQISKLEEKL